MKLEFLKEKKVIIETITKRYKVSGVVDLVETYVNKKLKNRKLEYTGTKLRWKSPLGKAYETVTPILVTNDYLEYLKLCPPYLNDYSIKWRGKTLNKHIFEGDLSRIEEYDPKNILLVNYSNYVFFDHKEKIYPAIYCGNYTEGNIDNEYYHIESLLEYIKKHKNVIKDLSDFQFDKVFDNGYLNLTLVPYYNNESGNKKHFNFFILPEQKKLQKIYDQLMEEKQEFWSIKLKEAILGKPYGDDPEYLNIKRFRKNPHNY